MAKAGDWEGEAPAEPKSAYSSVHRFGRSLILPISKHVQSETAVSV